MKEGGGGLVSCAIICCKTYFSRAMHERGTCVSYLSQTGPPQKKEDPRALSVSDRLLALIFGTCRYASCVVRSQVERYARLEGLTWTAHGEVLKGTHMYICTEKSKKNGVCGKTAAERTLRKFAGQNAGLWGPTSQALRVNRISIEEELCVCVLCKLQAWCAEMTNFTWLHFLFFSLACCCCCCCFSH